MRALPIKSKKRPRGKPFPKGYQSPGQFKPGAAHPSVLMARFRREAGYRTPRCQISTVNAKTAAQAIFRYMPPKVARELIKELQWLMETKGDEFGSYTRSAEYLAYHGVHFVKAPPPRKPPPSACKYSPGTVGYLDWWRKNRPGELTCGTCQHGMGGKCTPLGKRVRPSDCQCLGVHFIKRQPEESVSG
jgi:hypothetical protein